MTEPDTPEPRDEDDHARDRLMARARDQFVRHLDEHIDIEAKLAEVKYRAGLDNGTSP